MIHHHKPECAFSKLNLLNCQTFGYQTWCCDASLWAGVSCKKIGLLFWRSTLQQQKNTPKIHEFCPDDIFWFVDSFTTKLGMVMRHHEPDCLRKRLIFCLQGQGHTEGSYSQNMTFCMSSELLILLELNLVWLNCSDVVKVKDTREVQNSSDWASGQYLLNCWTLCSQTVLSCWDLFHGKFVLVSLGKASCDRVALPNLRCMQSVLVFS